MHSRGRARSGCGAEPRSGRKSRWSGCWGEGDLVAECHELADEVAGPSVRVDATLVEVGAQVDEAGVRVGEEVPDDDEDRAFDGDERLGLAPPAYEAPVALA